MPNPEPRFACSRPMRRNRFEAVTADAQTVFVGPECYRYIALAGEDGYQPPMGGPRLFALDLAWTCSACQSLNIGEPAAVYGARTAEDGLPTVLCQYCASAQTLADCPDFP